MSRSWSRRSRPRLQPCLEFNSLVCWQNKSHWSLQTTVGVIFKASSFLTWWLKCLPVPLKVMHTVSGWGKIYLLTFLSVFPPYVVQMWLLIDSLLHQCLCWACKTFLTWGESVTVYGFSWLLFHGGINQWLWAPRWEPTFLGHPANIYISSFLLFLCLVLLNYF